MHDKVLGIIRETLLHENTVVDIAVRLGDGQVVMTFSQPNEKSSWPDHVLVLTFEKVREFTAAVTGPEALWRALLGIECDRDADGYNAKFLIGEGSLTEWVLRLRFGDLRYKRT